MKFIKKNWKKIVLIVTGAIFCSIVFVIIGLFLWMKSWKTFRFPDSPVTFRYPEGGALTYYGPEGYNEYVIKYKNFFYLAVDHYNCSRNVTVPTSDKEACGEKSVDVSTEINALETHPFMTQIPTQTITVKEHKANILKLSTRLSSASKDTISNTTLAFNDKDEVYFLDFGNYFTDKNVVLKFISNRIFQSIITSIQFH